MKPLREGAVPVETEMPVHIPTPDGKKVAETITVKVPALKDLKTGELYLTGEALHILDKIKARRMGVLLPTEIKELREQLGLSQREISVVLGIGEKTYTRWETGRERPSHSLNRLLVALWEGRINLGSFRSMRQPAFPWYERITKPCPCGTKHEPMPIPANAEIQEEVPNESLAAAA
jgi:DNA-binding transcriptional regulator YiaG